MKFIHRVGVFAFILCAAFEFGIGAKDSDKLYFEWGQIDTSKPSLLEIPLRSKTPKYFIVQLNGPVFESQKKEIVRLGGTLLSYIPMNAFIVHMSPKVLKKIQKLSFVKWIGQYKQKYKVSSEILIDKNDEEVKYNIQFFPTENILPILKELHKKGARISEIAGHIVKISGKQKIVDFLKTQESVEWIEPDIEFEPMEDFEPPYEALAGYESGNKIIEPEPLHAMGVTGKTQILGYSDTGLDRGVNDAALHADFAGKIRSAYALPEGDWIDTMGHGTHIAGLLIGNGTLSQNKIRASSFDSKLVVQSIVLQGRLAVPLRVGHTILRPAYEDGARIHSNSWAGKVTNWRGYTPYTQSIDQFMWEHPDMLVIFPAGNSGIDSDKNGIVDEKSILMPSNCKNCLTVGASENLVLKGGIQINWQFVGLRQGKWDADPIASDMVSNNPKGIAAFSARGPTEDGRFKPDLVAPGTNILSTKSHSSRSALWSPYNNDYVWGGGTSASVPIVASGMALVREYLMEHKKIVSPSSALLKAIALNGAVELYPGQFGEIEKKEIYTQRPNIQEGWGLFNIPRSVLETDTRKIIFFDEKAGMTTSEKKEYDFKVIHSNEPVSVTLVYHDYPATLSTGFLVNDLDLEVQMSDGKILYPNRKEKKDNVNNVEGLDILNPSLGELKVKITAFNVPQGPNQPYALVVSGGVVGK